jgi:hypothetical protein
MPYRNGILLSTPHRPTVIYRGNGLLTAPEISKEIIQINNGDKLHNHVCCVNSAFLKKKLSPNEEEEVTKKKETST